MARAHLPYRETSDCFLLYKNKLVARVMKNNNDGSTYISLPGGGIDENEMPINGAKRECLEEVGAKLNSLKNIITVCWDWYPEWADTPKRIARYKQFRGEKIHIFIGTVNKFILPTSDEGDEWSGKKLISLLMASKILTTGMADCHPNIYPYRIAQLSVVNMLKDHKSF